MSEYITRANVLQFKDNLRHQVQQKGSRLLGAVSVEPITGEAHHFEILGKSTARLKSDRHGEATASDILHTRRRVTIQDFYDMIWLDKEDKIRMLIDPTSKYSQAISFGLGRKIDELVYDAALGNATEVTDISAGTTSTVALPSTQVVDEDTGAADSNLNFEKLNETLRLFRGNEVDDSEQLSFILNADALHALLAESEIQNIDTNSVRPLVNGQINSFMGFNFIRYEDLDGTADGTDTDPVDCIAFAKSGMGFAMGQDIMTEIERRNDRHYLTQVYASMTGGCVRIEDEKVVKIECVQS